MEYPRAASNWVAKAVCHILAYKKRSYATRCAAVAHFLSPTVLKKLSRFRSAHKKKRHGLRAQDIPQSVYNKRETLSGSYLCRSQHRTGALGITTLPRNHTEQRNVSVMHMIHWHWHTKMHNASNLAMGDPATSHIHSHGK